MAKNSEKNNKKFVKNLKKQNKGCIIKLYDYVNKFKGGLLCKKY